MRRVEMINNGSVSKGLAELNQHIRYEQNETRNGVTDEGQMLSEEDESRINEDSVNIIGSLQRSEVVIHRPQKQPQVPIVRWERFLHVRSLKVLLVENDDSTRHVVSALLRNCSYEVTAVENGVEAWKVLDDSTKRIDLILTEVAMPFMSGLGLLGKIMSHQTCKNIPVIMMSSHDSMGIVFKCLSKGAVDFLVKPIRKNELKNLWQHVWRKSRSSSGSGSESGIRTQKPAKMISADESDKSGSNDDEDDDQSINFNTRDGSDHGSGTQSSCIKKAVEVDSPQTVTEGGQSADDPADSTCAQVNYSFSRPEGLSYNHESVNATRKRQREDNDLGNTTMGKHLTIGITVNSNQLPEALNKMTVSNTEDTRGHKLPQMCSMKDDEVYEKGSAKQNIDTPSENLSNQPTVLMDFINNRFDFRMENSEFPIPNDKSNLPANKDNYYTKEMPSLELSLKSLRDIEDDGTDINEHNIWKPSSISAFSRYNSASTANPAPTGYISSSSPLDNSSEATPNMVFNSDSTPPNQHSNGSSNNNDMGSTTNNAFTKPAAFNDGYAPKVTVNIGNPSSAFQAVQNGHISHNQPNLPTKADSLTPNTVTGQAKETHPQVQVHHSHHHHHHHHHHVHKSAQHEKQSGQDDLTINNKTTASPQCGSSNVWRVPTNGHGSNNSMNGSGSGSNHGSNGQNGSSIHMYNEAVTVEGDTDIATNGGAGGTSGSGSRSGVDENYVARRMAALNKFRQKRKERCFEKKVRYHSRKRLAEQRPRVRGQFVRQTQENNCKETDS